METLMISKDDYSHQTEKQMIWAHMDFKSGLTLDAVVDHGAYVTAMAASDSNRIKQQAAAKVSKIDSTPNIQTDVANGQLLKSIATTFSNLILEIIRCKTLCRNEKTKRANHRVAILETQQSNHWYYRRPQLIFPTWQGKSRALLEETL